MKSARAHSRWLQGKGRPQHSVCCGDATVQWLRHDPGHLLQILSWYKFAAKLIGRPRRVLDVGCGEGMGTWILLKECGTAAGIDIDREALTIARCNWAHGKVRFREGSILKTKRGFWDGVVCLDASRCLRGLTVTRFVNAAADGLARNGVVVVGVVSGHQERVARRLGSGSYDSFLKAFRRRFVHVLVFSAQGELIRAGPRPGSDIVLLVGVQRRSSRLHGCD